LCHGGKRSIKLNMSGATIQNEKKTQNNKGRTWIIRSGKKCLRTAYLQKNNGGREKGEEEGSKQPKGRRRDACQNGTFWGGGVKKGKGEQRAKKRPSINEKKKLNLKGTNGTTKRGLKKRGISIKDLRKKMP